MYDVITVRCISMCARVTCIFFLIIVRILTWHSVYVYIYICVFNIYCIVRSVPMRGTNTTRSDTETRNAPPKKKKERKKRIFFLTAFVRWESARSIARFSNSACRVLHSTFLRTSFYRRYIEIFSLLPRYSKPRQRRSAHVYLRYQFLKILNSIPIFCEYLLGRLESIANASLGAPSIFDKSRSILRKIRSEDTHSRPKV